MDAKCVECDGLTGAGDDLLPCSSCTSFIHRRCSGNELQLIYCKPCYNRLLSSSDEEEDSVENDVLYDNITNIDLNELQRLEELEVFTNDTDEMNVNLDNMDIDPDLNYFNRAEWSSDYISVPTLINNLGKSRRTEGRTLSLLHINCRSILSKLTEIRELATDLQVAILALSETWLNNETNQFVNIPGYVFVSNNRKGEPGGGVGLLIRNDLKFQLYNPLCSTEPSTFESLFIRLKLKNSSLIIGVIYRPPGQALKEFNEEIDDMLSSFKKTTTGVILLGDFNINLLKVNDHKDTNLFYNNLVSNHYLPVITKPTRITVTTKTLIDNIFTTVWSQLISASIIISDLSDHLPLFAKFSLETANKRPPQKVDNRPITAKGKEQFTKAIIDMNWDPVLSHCAGGRVSQAYDCFFNKYIGAYNSAFPIQPMNEKKTKTSFVQPWMTTALLKSCKKKSVIREISKDPFY